MAGSYLIVIAMLILALYCLTCTEKFENGRQDPEFVGDTRTVYSPNSLDALLDQAVQTPQPQLATPSVPMPHSEAQKVIDAAMLIVKLKTKLHLTIIYITSAEQQTTASIQLSNFNVIVYDKGRNCLYALTLSAVRDAVTGRLAVSQCRMTSKLATPGQYEAVRVPGYNFEFGKPE